MSKEFGLTVRVFLAGCCILMGCCLSVYGGAKEKDAAQTWVSVTVLSVGKNTTAEYLGQIENTVLDGIISHSISNGFFKLESTFWYDSEGRIKQLKNSTQQGKPYGYSSTIFLRVDLLIRIALLDETLVNDIISNKQKNAEPSSAGDSSTRGPAGLEPPQK